MGSKLKPPDILCNSKSNRENGMKAVHMRTHYQISELDMALRASPTHAHIPNSTHAHTQKNSYACTGMKIQTHMQAWT